MKWLNTQEAGQHARLTAKTIRRRCESAVLHGHQHTRKSPWVVHQAALDVHIQGGDEAAQKAACGCDRVLRAVS
jgi:hypothetical protein